MQPTAEEDRVLIRAHCHELCTSSFWLNAALSDLASWKKINLRNVSCSWQPQINKLSEAVKDEH